MSVNISIITSPLFLFQTFQSLMLSLPMLMALSAHAQAKEQYLCVNNPTLNIRSNANTESTILWKVVRHYPFQILISKGQWHKVKDFEGDIGWAHSRYLSKDACTIVKNKFANIRISADENSKKVGQANYGDVFAVTKTTNNWVQIQFDSKAQGWIYAPLLWGTPQ